MIDIQIKKEDKKITYFLTGKLNSEVASEFKEYVKDAENEVDEMILDFKDLKYISSAGLRVILEIHKKMKEQNKILTLINVDSGNMDILESTGLTKFLNIKND